MYKPFQAAALVPCSRAALRKYAIEFRDHFSPNAYPGPGIARQYTTDDVRLVRFILNLTSGGATLAEVRNRLDAGEFADFDWQPGPVPGQEPPLSPPQPEPPTSLVLMQQLDQSRQAEQQLWERVIDAEKRAAGAEAELSALKAQVGMTEGPRISWWRRLFGA